MLDGAIVQPAPPCKEPRTMTDELGEFLPIDDSAKDGRDLLVRAGGDLACAFWTGDMWAYGGAAREGAVVQLDFEPRLYRELKQ